MTRIAVVAAMLAGTIFFGSNQAISADLFRHSHYRSHSRGDIYADDYACPLREPSVYKPRIANYHEPLCYAARPYGISTHLYDHPSDLVRGVGALRGY